MTIARIGGRRRPEEAHPRQRTTPEPQPQPVMVSLYTGAGGLDVGLEAAGFSTAICVEVDGDARATLQQNRPNWKLSNPADIFDIEPAEILSQAKVDQGDIALLAAGPPCQPYSKSAFWAHRGANGSLDPRASAVPAYFQVVDVALPRVLLLENVKGFASSTDKANGVEPVGSLLEAINLRHGTNYKHQFLQINAASYGVPQVRERLFMIASIDGRSINLPTPTHGDGDHLAPFRTAWDALGDLDTTDWDEALAPTGKWAGLLHSIPEGKNYLWHTPRSGGEPLFGWRTRYWSFLLKLSKNRPSWTIQAEPGPATGPFHWNNRTLSIAELARLQTFPDDYHFVGDRRSAHRQIGNAVPCAIGELLGLEIRRQLLDDATVRKNLTLTPERRDNCPPPNPPQPLSAEYLPLIGEHPDHPGEGLGPGRRWQA